MLRVHFLNVGHGECTIIEHPSGRLTMVDINTSQEYDSDSLNEYIEEKRRARLAANPLAGGMFGPGIGVPSPLLGGAGTNLLFEYTVRDDAKREVTDPIDFLRTYYPNRQLFRFILTHPDLDHMRGLKRLHETIGFANFWDVAHTKTAPTFRNDLDKQDWHFYQQLRSGSLGLAPRIYYRGDCLFAFGRDEQGFLGGDAIEILWPTPALVYSCNTAEKSNDLSYVLRISHADRSVLLTGDIEEESWSNLVLTYGVSLKTDFMSASHHGRDSGYYLPALKLVAPLVIVVSVGRKPPTDASRKYCANCSNVFSTRYYGNLELRIFDDGTNRWFAQRNAT